MEVQHNIIYEIKEKDWEELREIEITENVSLRKKP